MTSNKLPWDEIREPRSDYNVRKIAESETIPLYWGRDAAGRCLLILQLDGDHTEQFRKRNISVHGMKVDLRQLDATKSQSLVITLEYHVDRDLFLALCNTLILALKDVADSAVALSVVMMHIKRWKAFMAGKRTRILSAEEVRGLYSELTFFRSIYPNNLNEKSTVDAWCGAEGSHQDFIFENTAVEIKSLSGKERNTVRISSEDQLEGLCDNLYMIVYRLSEMPESDSAASLNDLVKIIESELTDSEAIEEFSRKLVAYGYVEMREYDEPKFVVSGKQTFRVSEDFPCIVRSNLPIGLVRVKYEIEMEKIKPFECDMSQVWG